MPDTKPLISIFMSTYNHGTFIEEAIRGCMEQNTEYPFELIICDDFSTDGTREKATAWAKKHANIVLSFQDHNTKGIRNMMQGLSLARGKYLAICEGDDYWTDPEKLQTQVSFLELNPEFSVSCHRVRLLYSGDIPQPEQPQFIYKDCTADEDRIKNGIFYADEVVDNYYMHTSSMVFRWKFRNGLPKKFRSRMLLDHFLLLLHAADGKIKYFDKDMSIWRRHASGYSWAQLHDKGLFFQREGDDWITCYREIDAFFHKRFHLQIRERLLLALRSLVNHYLASGQTGQLRELICKNWDIIKTVLENEPLLEAVRMVLPQDRDFVPPWTSEKKIAEQSGVSMPLQPVLGLDSIVVPKGNVMERWIGGREWTSFGNAEAAIMSWLSWKGINCLWVPIGCPPALEKIFFELQILRKYYLVDDRLNTSPDFLNLAKAGEGVMTMSWFGRPVARSLRMGLAARPDLHWLENRTYALSACETEAEAVVYSPMATLGTPDGGIIIGEGVSRMPHGERSGLETLNEGFALSLATFETGETDLRRIRTFEEKFLLPGGTASRISLELLKRLPYTEICRVRQHNWKTLYGKLAKWAFWKLKKTSFAPFCFPVAVPDGLLASALVSQFVRAGIEAQRWHFDSFTEMTQICYAQKLKESLVLLPCGQNLTESNLRHIAETAAALLSGKNVLLTRSERSFK